MIERQATPAAAVTQPATPAHTGQSKQKIVASPIAKRIAREHGIDIAAVPGAGERRLTQKDVEDFIAAGASQTPASPPSPSQAAGQTVPFAGMRAAIARRMHQSLQEMAQLTLHTEADVTEMVALREVLKAEQKVTYTDMIVRAAALALQKHPHLNATLNMEEKVIQLHPTIEIGLAIAVDNGLVVPVIRQAGQKSLSELAQARQTIIERARSGKLASTDLEGSTFTITNLGTYDIDGFTPIINPPEIAILGVGRIVEKVVVHQGKIAQRGMMTLSLSFDHRVVDGAPAAAFLQTIKQNLEQPAVLDSSAKQT